MPTFYKYISPVLFSVLSLNANAGITEEDSLKLDTKIQFMINRANINPDSVLFVCEESLKEEYIDKSPFFKSGFLSLAAKSEWRRANYAEAQKYIEEAIDLREKHNYPLHLATSYTIFAHILMAIEEEELAKSYLFKSLALKKESGNPDYLKGTYSAIGKFYYQIDEYDSSNFFYSQALKIYEEQQDLQGLGSVYSNLANNKYMLDYNMEAIADYRKSVSYYMMDNRLAESARPLMNIGEVYNYLEVYDSAAFYFNLALNSVRDGGNNRLVDFIYQGLAETYVGMGEPDSAVIMFERYISYRDSIFEQEKTNAILEYEAEYEAKYDTEKAEQQAAFEKSEKEKVQAQNASNRKTIYVLLSVVALILGIVIYLVRNARQKSKLRALEIDTKNQEIDTLLKEQEAKSYAAMLEGQNTERERIAQDLHDRLGGTLAAVKVHFNLMDKKIEEIKSENRELFDKVNTMLSDAVQDVRRISHDLASSRLSKLGLKGALEDLAQILNKAKKMEVDFFMDDAIPGLEKKKEQEVYAILQELVSNTLKHANATSVEMQLNRQDDMLNILYEDNGVGFEMKDAEKKGLGLTGLSNRVHRLEGTINFDSVVGRGTIVIINIPL